jgi:T5orf172 domain
MQNTPSRKSRRQRPGANSASADSQIDHSTSSPTTITNEGEDYFGSSPPTKQGPDSEDGSPSHVESISSPNPEDDSISSAHLRTPSKGGEDEIWEWSITKQRNMMFPAFYWLVQSLYSDLTPDEIPQGYIYAFRVIDPRGKNHLKIGFSKEITRRMKSHSDCYGDHEQVYPSRDEDFALINHARRVERLVHAELVEQGMSLARCPNERLGHNRHGEWFKVEEEHVLAVIRKWSGWMSSSPYEEKPFNEAEQRELKRKESAKAERAKEKAAKAESTKAESPDATPEKKKKKKSLDAAPTTKWQLRAQEPSWLMEICWPLSPWATAPEGDDFEEVGARLRRLTLS